jgi:hypothetical protein
LSAIERADARGVYLNRTRGEIRDLTLGGWSSLGNRDLNTEMSAGGVSDLDGVPTPLDGADAAATTTPLPMPDAE